MKRRASDRQEASVSAQIDIPDIVDILHIFYRRKFLFIVLVFFPVTLGLLYLKNAPETYRATASVIFEPQDLKLEDFQDILSGMKFDDMTVPTQISMIASPELVRQTIADLGLYENEKGDLTISPYSSKNAAPPPGRNENGDNYAVLRNFLDNMNASQQGSSRVVEISFTAKNPAMAAKIANTHTKQYVYSHVRAQKEQALRLNEWLSGQIIGLKQESLDKSRAVQKYRAENGMILGRNSQELVYQQISDVAAQLTPVETRELDLLARNDLLKKGNAHALSEVVGSKLIQDLKASASTAGQKLRALQSQYGNNHPDVLAAQKEFDQINSDIAREIDNIKTSIQNELATVSRQKELLNQKLEELKHKADLLQEKQITLEALQLEESASQNLLNNFLARSEEIKSQIDFARPDVRIVALAAPPDKPVAPNKPLLAVVILFLSSAFALAVIFLLEMRDSGVDDTHDARKLLELRLLGTLPQEKTPILKVLNKDRCPYLEEIKRLYAHLSKQGNIKTVLFCSAHEKEGKSTVAMSLAYYINNLGKKVVVIDADSLAPSVAGITLTQNKPGLYELLKGTHKLEAVTAREKNGLSIIAAGAKSAQISDLLFAGRFASHLEAIEKKFDYVIIDCASVLSVSDAEILSALVDQVIMVAAWSKTSQKDLKAAAGILRQAAKNIPGMVLNKIDPKDLQGAM